MAINIMYEFYPSLGFSDSDYDFSIQNDGATEEYVTPIFNNTNFGIPGLYGIVNSHSQLAYVGITSETLNKRINSRVKSYEDFGTIGNPFSNCRLIGGKVSWKAGTTGVSNNCVFANSKYLVRVPNGAGGTIDLDVERLLTRYLMVRSAGFFGTLHSDIGVPSDFTLRAVTNSSQSAATSQLDNPFADDIEVTIQIGATGSVLAFTIPQGGHL